MRLMIHILQLNKVQQVTKKLTQLLKREYISADDEKIFDQN